jgi:hypothetical protein
MRRRRRQTNAKGGAGTPAASTPSPSSTPGAHRPADGSGQDVLGRLRAAVESIRRQLAARWRTRDGPRR